MHGFIGEQRKIEIAMVQNLEPAELLAVDVSNRTTCFGLFGTENLLQSWTVTTPASLTADEAMLSLLSFIATQENCPIADAQKHIAPLGSILSCVVPDLTNAWEDALRTVCLNRPLVVGPGLKTGIKMKYNEPAEVGSDRIADIVAAKHRYGYPLIIIDCGMTVNYAILDQEGAFIGGLIAPGISLSGSALSQAAARLPIVRISSPKSVIGKNTRESMQAGIVMGEAARIDGLINMIWHELGFETSLLLAGEDARLLEPLLSHSVICDDTLTLQGLKLLYESNRKK